MAASATLLEPTVLETNHHSKPIRVLDLPIPSGPTGRNRRFFPRTHRLFNAVWSEDGSVLEGIDVSFGGMMCRAKSPVWPGNVSQFDLRLSGEAKPLTVMGRVEELVGYRGETAMRVKFIDIDVAGRKRLAHWMARELG